MCREQGVATNKLVEGPGTESAGAGIAGKEHSDVVELDITTVRSPADAAEADALVDRRPSAERSTGDDWSASPGEASRVLLARRGGEAVGVARICWPLARRAGEVRRGRLSHLYVVPEARSAGAGEALLRRAAVVAWWSGCHDLRVHAETGAAAGSTLLERVGFQPEGEGGDLVLSPRPTGR